MQIFLHIAFRNLLRHPRRSLLTLTAVAVGLGAIIFLWSFTDGAHHQMIENITRAHTSDAQILPSVLEYIYDTTKTIDHPEFVHELLEKDARILAYADRILGGGLVSSASQSMPTYVIGIDPEREDAIESRRTVIRGASSVAGKEHWIGMGERMRQILDVDIGGKIVVTVQDYFGSFSSAVFRLAGTFETGNDQIDNQSVFISAREAQELFSFGGRVSRIALKIDPRYDLQEVVRDLRRELASRHLSVQTWEELLPMVAQMIHFNNNNILLVMVIILGVVTLGILNTMMISIVERTREFGLMMALGTQGRQVGLLVSLETALLTLCGSLLGVALGCGFSLTFGHFGIDLSRYQRTFSNLLIGSHVYPRLEWDHLLISLAVILLSTLIVSLYAALRVKRLEPIEAMGQSA